MLSAKSRLSHDIVQIAVALGHQSPSNVQTSQRHTDERNDVFATGITGIYDHLFRSLTCTLFDLLHRGNKMFVIRSCLASIHSDDNSGGNVRPHLHVIAQCTRCSWVFHDPYFWIRDARPGLLFTGLVIAGSSVTGPSQLRTASTCVNRS